MTPPGDENPVAGSNSIDSRCGPAKAFDRIVAGIQNDLGGRDQLSTVESALIEAFAGATVHVNQLNALLLLGEAIDLADHAAAISAMVRVAARIGLRRRPRDITPSVAEYVAHIKHARRGGGMRPTISLRKALADKGLLGNVLAGDSWAAWRTCMIAAMGEALSDDERALFKQLTGGREREPGERIEEAAFVVGRRGGKIARHGDAGHVHRRPMPSRPRSGRARPAALHRARPAAGGHHVGLLRGGLRGLADPFPADSQPHVLTRSILTNGVSVEVRAASFRRLRGPTYIAVIADEAAFWYSDEFSANADSEILNAVRPGLATTGGPLIIASSPYARRGVLWDIHRRHYGPDGDPLILVAQGASRDFNPSLKQAVVDRAMERDPASAAAEYMAQFRTDIESFVNREAVEACVALDIRERAPQSGLRYSGFVDPSGGSQDSFTLAVAHRDSDATAVLDAVREVRPPFSPEAVVAEFAATLRSYRVTKVSGDRYAGEWPREQFRKFGITYEVAAKPKSDLFRDLLPMLNSRRVELLDHPKLIAQLAV